MKKFTPYSRHRQLRRLGSFSTVLLLLVFMMTSFKTNTHTNSTKLASPPPIDEVWIDNQSSSEILVAFYKSGSVSYTPVTNYICAGTRIKYPADVDEIRIAPAGGSTYYSVMEYSGSFSTLCTSCWAWSSCATGSGNGNIQGKWSTTTYPQPGTTIREWVYID